MADINEPVCVIDQNKCIICLKDADDDLIGVTDRGMQTLISCCELRGWLTLKGDMQLFFTKLIQK